MFTIPSGADTEMPTTSDQIQPGCFVSGPTLPEPIEVLAVVPMGALNRGNNLAIGGVSNIELFEDVTSSTIEIDHVPR